MIEFTQGSTNQNYLLADFLKNTLFKLKNTIFKY